VNDRLLLIYLGFMLFDWIFLVFGGYWLAKKGLINLRKGTPGIIFIFSLIPVLNILIILICALLTLLNQDDFMSPGKPFDFFH